METKLVKIPLFWQTKIYAWTSMLHVILVFSWVEIGRKKRWQNDSPIAQRYMNFGFGLSPQLEAKI